MSVWNVNKAEQQLNKSFDNNSETELLKVLKNNSFLFYELYSRKYGIQPNFKEISFGGKYRCDFAWLNDNSDGPEWVLVEIEKPKMELFAKNLEPRAELNHSIEQVKSWIRYFNENPAEKRRIFGAVSRFKYILVAGDIEDWGTEAAIKWRAYHNSVDPIEIRSSNIFKKAIKIAKEKPEELWSFEENPKSLKSAELESYWTNYKYMDRWRQIMK
ncbi:Shedu anti-phage system protein SduA domain-containing protein [uncultured Sunxiuqinia sp.]|uniref:Shedu anti-phage system protein SduA domain-containing protein n=1 Tax=uncultured Sunxiuqinia sp. TaxID=1573825 RepID=UPI002AA8FB45|nr:Shedu anti-phage system protein SduA domain-containing protein [uncultured Sunxiuqinia sp.]